MSDPTTPCKPAPAGESASERFGPLLDPATPAGATVRTAVACVLAMALAFALHVEVPALAVVFVLARGSAGVVTMLAGASAGSAVAIVLVALFDQSRGAFSVALFVLTGLATYGALGRVFPYAFVQGLLGCLIVVGQSLDTPDDAVVHAFYGLANVAIAAAAAFVAGAAQPVAVPARLQDALADHLRLAARLLREGGAAPATALRLALSSRLIHVLLAASWPTRQVTRARRRTLAAAVADADALLRDVLALDGRARAGARADAAGLAGSARALADRIDRVAPLLHAHRGPLPRDRSAFVRATRALADEVRAAEPGADWPGAPLAARVAASARCTVARLARRAPFLQPGAPAGSPADGRAAGAPQRWRTNRFRVRHAVKSAASYLLVLWAWVASEWGAIVPALVVAVLVATLATPLGATMRKAVLRVGGVLAGGILGLLVAVVLLPYVTTLPAICAIAGVVLLGLLWIQQHDERLVFAALQAAIAFALTLVHGAAPSPTWREPLESLIGLAFGITVVVLVMHAAWPIDASTAARSVLADLLRLNRRRALALAAPDRPESRAGDARDQEAAARSARALAAGFVHEVELYGAQFGRPDEDLAGVLRAVVELDAVLALAAASTSAGDGPRPPELEPLSSVYASLGRACAAVARALEATGERSVDGDAERLLSESQRSADDLGDLVGAGAPEIEPLARAAGLAAALLAEAHGRQHAARRAWPAQRRSPVTAGS